MKNLKYKIKNSNLVELIIHNIKLCLLGTNGNYLKFIIFFGVSISTALFESSLILIVIPFIGILTNSEKAFDNKLVKILGNLLDIDDTEKIMLPITVIFILIIIFSSLMRFINSVYLTKFNASISNTISKTFFKKIVCAPYEFFIIKNSSELLNSLTSEVSSSNFSIQAFLSGINALFVSFFILFTVFLINIKISIYVVLVMSTTYLLIAFFKNKQLKRISRILSIADRKKMKLTQESIISIRDLILNGNQKTYIRRFNLYSNKREFALADTYITGVYPKYLVEATGLSLIGIIAFSLRSYENIDPLPILAALTLGLQKLLPQIQTIYNSFANITASFDISKNLFSLISNIEEKNNFPEFNPKLRVKLDSLQLVNVSYKYPNTNKSALENINLYINRGDKIGIIGKTGAGKSTIVELITTLLEPTQGKILFNGLEISSIKNRNNLMAWRKNISYVPQFIALNDGSVLENIAFGIPSNEIDIEKAKNCAKTALIYDHIKTMKEGIFTVIGERGIKLSGGQIQRIGIARALYSKAEVLVLDEATSALDTKTEEKLVKSIAMRNKDLTILAISHRLSTLENYERIVKVENKTITEKNKL